MIDRFVPPAGVPDVGKTKSGRRWENSEVFPSGSVAVADTGSFAATSTGSVTSMAANPAPSVVTEDDPR